MSMFLVSGEVLHLYAAPGYRDRETGKYSEDKPKVQLLGDLPLRNGEVEKKVLTVTCDHPEDFQPLKGKQVLVPLGMFSPAKDNIIYFIPKGCKPVLVPAGFEGILEGQEGTSLD